LGPKQSLTRLGLKQDKTKKAKNTFSAQEKGNGLGREHKDNVDVEMEGYKRKL
jgi:hypothetical protein